MEQLNEEQFLRKFSEMSFTHSAFIEFMNGQQPIMQDDVVMTAFRDAIREPRHAHIFAGATVLEVGCGSALLSMLVARQGAARVFAVDSGDVAQVARHLVRENGLDDVIEVIQGDIRQLKLPPIDVIVAKWMGACLLYSTALDEVIYARDKWLKSKGYIFPDTARLYLSVAEDRDRDPPRHYWSRFAGLNMSRAACSVQHLPKVERVLQHQLISEPQQIWQMDVRTISSEQLSFTVPFKLHSQRREIIDLFVVHFDFGFPGGTAEEVVSTSPCAPSTHWRQTVFHIDQHLPIEPGDRFAGTFGVSRGANHLDFDIDWSYRSRLVKIKSHKQIFRMFGGQQGADIAEGREVQRQAQDPRMSTEWGLAMEELPFSLEV
ncbi:protein arginine N-methyltransferase 1-B-like [Drosophila obscura]|uniref:protein arginine N-methyltransferase 1-B-like n=1 Tax=Drosophila obscura TaxID=7282 RepID=UPI001BB229DA|nr:protein arginine N-methyltransferase 1-B-like [Drosophila obscura]